MAFDLDDDELEATRKMHKGSNINVGSIEEDIKILKNYLKNSAYKESNSDFFKNGGWEIVDLEVPQALEHLIVDYTRQKHIDEEHQMINGELSEKIKALEQHLQQFYNGELYTAKQLKNIEKNQNKCFVNKEVIKEILKKYEHASVDDIDVILQFYQELKKLVEDK